MAPRALLFLAAAPLLGCGDDATSGGDDEPPPACEVSVALSGGHVETLPGGEIGCASAFGPSTGVKMIYLPGTEIGQLIVDVADITEGATGMFPAAVRILLDDEREWVTELDACSAEVVEHSFAEESELSKAYQMAGQIGCAGSAAPIAPNTGAAVEIGPMTFRFRSHW
jgi:hypothetical protein